jgi:hypothetical protein
MDDGRIGRLVWFWVGGGTPQHRDPKQRREETGNPNQGQGITLAEATARAKRTMQMRSVEPRRSRSGRTGHRIQTHPSDFATKKNGARYQFFLALTERDVLGNQEVEVEVPSARGGRALPALSPDRVPLDPRLFDWGLADQVQRTDSAKTEPQSGSELQSYHLCSRNP